MIPAPFDYVRPDSVDEAVRALENAGEDGKVLAGWDVFPLPLDLIKPFLGPRSE